MTSRRSGNVVGISDGVVRRRAGPWTPAVHRLLRHLEAVGFPSSPRVLGLDPDGTERLRLIPGTSGRQAWAEVVPEAGLRAFARLLRDYHDAVASFRPEPLVWGLGRQALADGELIGHGDFGPWNTVWSGHRPVGIIDWDFAGPRPPHYDVAYALEYVAPFRDDETCLRSLAHPEPPDRARRVEAFLDAYGLDAGPDAGFDAVEEVAAVQEEAIAVVRALAGAGRRPQADRVAGGYLDVLRARVAWTRAHRHLFGPA